MSSQNTFPWDSLKAETLRSIVNDLGIPVARSLRKREGMIKLLISVTEKGCESRFLFPPPPPTKNLRVWVSVLSVYVCVLMLSVGVVEKTVEEYQEIANKEQAEEKTTGNDKAKASKPSKSTGGGAVRTRKGSRNTSTFEGVVLPSGSTRTRRPSAKARS